MFPDLDLSSARVKSYAPILPPQGPSVSGSRGLPQTPVVTGPRGILQAPIVTGPRGVRRPPAVTEPAHVETPPSNPRSSTRISLVRHPAPPQPQEEAPVPVLKQEGKKGKKGGKEKSKDKKGKSKSKAKNCAKEKELVEEPEVESDDQGDQGIMHPVDLVIHKKKRKGREHTGSRTVNVSSQLGQFNLEEMRETSSRGFSVGPSGNAGRGSQQQAAPRSRAPAASPASSRRSAPQPDTKVGAAVTVLKKSRSDGGKRRPSHP